MADTSSSATTGTTASAASATAVAGGAAPARASASSVPDGTKCPEYCSRVLWTRQQIDARVAELGRELSEHYAALQAKEEKPAPVVLVGVLKGAFMFAADLARAMTVDHEVEFLSVSSYGDAAASSGSVRLNLDCRRDIAGKHVVIVEDVVDTGRTLNFLVQLLAARGPASIEVLPFVSKEGALQVPAESPAANPRWIGFTAPNEFLVGYGLDWAEKYRTLPFVGILKPSVYSKA